jgi:replication-associated recombination protein RarA
MKKLGYGKEYSYNPDFGHPVTNVSLEQGEDALCPVS